MTISLGDLAREYNTTIKVLGQDQLVGVSGDRRRATSGLSIKEIYQGIEAMLPNCNFGEQAVRDALSGAAHLGVVKKWDTEEFKRPNYVWALENEVYGELARAALFVMHKTKRPIRQFIGKQHHSKKGTGQLSPRAALLELAESGKLNGAYMDEYSDEFGLATCPLYNMRNEGLVNITYRHEKHGPKVDKVTVCDHGKLFLDEFLIPLQLVHEGLTHLDSKAVKFVEEHRDAIYRDLKF